MSQEREEAVQAYNVAMIAFVAAQAAFMMDVFGETAGDADYRADRVTALEQAEWALEGAEQVLERHQH